MIDKNLYKKHYASYIVCHVLLPPCMYIYIYIYILEAKAALRAAFPSSWGLRPQPPSLT